MQNDFDKICDWFYFNKLSINTKKIETVSFGSNRKNTLKIIAKSFYETFAVSIWVCLVSKLTSRVQDNYVVIKTQYILWPDLESSGFLINKIFNVVLQCVF